MNPSSYITGLDTNILLRVETICGSLLVDELLVDRTSITLRTILLVNIDSTNEGEKINGSSKEN